MSLEPRASVRMVLDEEGALKARVGFSDVMFSVDPKAVRVVDGVLHIAIPTWIDVPYGVTVVERWLSPTAEQVRLAVEGLDAVALERILACEQMTAPANESWGQIVRRAVALAVSGDLGEEES